MPIYEYHCNRCGKIFEHLIFSTDEVEILTCPSCGQDDTCRLMSTFCCGSSESSGQGAAGPSSSCSPSSGGFS